MPSRIIDRRFIVKLLCGWCLAEHDSGSTPQDRHRRHEADGRTSGSEQTPSTEAPGSVCNTARPSFAAQLTFGTACLLLDPPLLKLKNVVTGTRKNSKFDRLKRFQQASAESFEIQK